MLLHLGGAWAINARRVVGVFDLSGISLCRETRDMMRRAAREQCLERVEDGPPKSIVLVQQRPGVTRVILSPISAATLRQRLAEGGSEPLTQFDFT